VMFSMEGKCEKKSVEEDRAKMSTPRVKCHAAFFPRGGSQRPTQIEALGERADLEQRILAANFREFDRCPKGHIYGKRANKLCTAAVPMPGAPSWNRIL